eukprot:TRINITY_DN8635_c0_g1_i1.p1 TRINITY_DN8635_c0_g1~~TRINITY_DN8635_c0_g1_i1.p1  ORF type:complete len:346 (+),score=71.37 TRINITY_DN8635_c0_g1_i1:166-1203(+)
MTVELVTPGEMEGASPSPTPAPDHDSTTSSPTKSSSENSNDDNNNSEDEYPILRRLGFYAVLFLFIMDIPLLVYSATLYAGHTLDYPRLDPEGSFYRLATAFIPVILFLNFILLMIFLRWYRVGKISSNACACGGFVYVVMTAGCIAFFGVFMSMYNLDSKFDNLPDEVQAYRIYHPNNITLYNMNNVHSQIGAGESTYDIIFLGTYDSSNECIQACNNYTHPTELTTSCHTWTWYHDVSKNDLYAGQCFGRTDLEWGPKAQTDVDCGITADSHYVHTSFEFAYEWTGDMFRDMLQTNHDALVLYVLLLVRFGIPVVVPALALVGFILFGLIALILLPCIDQKKK